MCIQCGKLGRTEPDKGQLHWINQNVLVIINKMLRKFEGKCRDKIVGCYKKQKNQNVLVDKMTG